MTQVPNDAAFETPAEAPESPAADAGTQEFQPQTQAPEAPQTPAPDDGYVRIPRDQQGPGGWHEDLRRSTEYQRLEEQGLSDLMATVQSTGMTPRQFNQWLRGQAEANDGTQQQEPQGDGEDAPLTRKEFLELMEQREQQSQQKQTLQQARSEEANFIASALQDGKYEFDESGRPKDNMARGAKALLYDALAEAQEEGIGKYLTGAARQKALQDALQRPANKAELARAREIWQARMKDLENGFLNRASDAQQQLPGSTVAGGGSGRPPKQAKDMSRDEEINYVTRHMADRTAPAP